MSNIETRDALLVFGHRNRRAGAGLLQITIISARAKLHIETQRKIRGFVPLRLCGFVQLGLDSTEFEYSP
jgi:hypothetical protein